jgi:hypothetical protein
MPECAAPGARNATKGRLTRSSGVGRRLRLVFARSNADYLPFVLMVWT